MLHELMRRMVELNSWRRLRSPYPFFHADHEILDQWKKKRAPPITTPRRAMFMTEAALFFTLLITSTGGQDGMPMAPTYCFFIS
ncbi:hypothetical protein F4809DRAFT_594528 [Biscogniauxia mediterranea]|nr:hypothetical protein F4809DRAFT_594528 [Biscogniauxia mediterranea]